MRKFYSNTKLFILFFLLLSFQSTNLLAQTAKRIVVKSGYSGSSTDTTATIKAAVDAAVSRDSIIVLEGTFKEKFAITGGKEKIVMGSLFLLDGDTSHIRKTIISGSGVTQNSKNDVLAGFYTNSWDTVAFKFIGFTIDSASKWAMDARGGLVSDCIFRNSGSLQTIPFYFQATRLRNITVHNNQGGAIIFFQGYGLNNAGAANSYNNIENSIFYRNKAVAQTNVDYQAPVWPGWGAIVSYSQDTKGKVVNSIFYNNSGDNLFNYGGHNITDTLDFINNVIYKNNTRTASFRSWEGDNGRENIISRWYNNIIDNNYKLATESNNSEFRWGGDRPHTYQLRNNILAEAINTDNQTGFRNSFTWDHLDSIIATVTFVDTANLNFTPRDNNPGFGGGKSAAFVPTDDFNGNARPNPTGSNVDIGAIETSLSAPLPQVTSLQNALISSKRSVKVNYKVLNFPAIDSIIIYRATSRDTSVILGNPIDTIKFKTTDQPTFVDTNAIANNTKYYYLIKTFYSNKLKSRASIIDSVSTPAVQSTVSVPTAVTLTPSGRSYFQVSWTSANKVATATSTTPYIDIYRGQSISDAVLLVSLRDTAVSYTDKTTLPETKYVYYLVNRDVNGVVSDTSANISSTTTGASPLRFYVDAANGNDNNAGTAENAAYKTLAFAFTQTVKGDTVIALRGTYNEKFKIVPGTVLGSKYLIDNTDTASRRLTILSATGLNGSMITYSAQPNDGQTRRTKIIGLHLKNAAGSGKYLFTSDGFWNSFMTIDNCYFSSNGPANLQYVEGRNPDQDIIYASFNDSTVITNSIFEYNNGRFDVNGSNIQISKNIFRYNNNTFERPNGHWIGYGVFRGWVSNKTVISDNIFMFNGKSYTDGWQDDQYAVVSIAGGNLSDSIFYINNTFYKNQFIALQFNNQNPNTHLVNNIFFKNGSRKAKDFQLRSSSPSGKFFFQNNFFTYDPKNDADLSNLDASIVDNLIGSNLLLADSTNLLSLDPSSDLINAGRNTFGTSGSSSVASKDLYGTSRPSPSGSNSDIGAVESVYGFPSPYLVSADGGDSTVTIKWRKPSNGSIDGYEIFRSTSAIPASTSTGAVYTINKADSSIVIDKGLTNLTKYYYRIRAFSGTSSKTYSGLSNELSVRPNIPPTGVDTLVAFAGPRNVAVRWKDTSTVKRKYNIYRGLTSANLEKIASGIDTTYYVDKTVNANTKYFFAVSVVDSVGASSVLSKAAFATPSNIWAIDTAGKVANNGSATLPFKSIQYAIDNSLEGDTIVLNDGIYNENLVLEKKSIVLMAKKTGMVTIQPFDNESPLFTVRDDNPWNSNSYAKPKNRIIGIRFTRAARTQWSNNGPNTGFYIYGNSDPYFEACQFVNNTTTQLFYIDQSGPMFVNCLVANNNNSSGLFNGWGDSSYTRTKITKFINSTITNNTYLNIHSNLNEKTIIFFNCILSENGYDNRFNIKIHRAIGSVVDNAKFVAQSATNINADPQFNNPSIGDYSISNTSPALGRMVDQYVLVGSNGNDTLKAISFDYNNAARPQPAGSKGDAGAFENKNSFASPLITRLQRTGTNVTLTWEKSDPNITIASLKVYRDTSRTALDTVAALSITPNVSTSTISDVLPNSKEHFYAIRAVVGSVTGGLSNIKSSLDTIFIPSVTFGTDTASLKVRGTCRNCGNSTTQINLVNSGTTTTAGYLPKLIMYSQRMRTVDSTSGIGTPEDSLLVLNLLKGTGTNSIKFGLNKYASIAKGKGDYMHIVNAQNVNGDDEFDFVAYFRKNGDDDQKNKIAYLINSNFNFRIDTTTTPKAFNEPNYNNYGQSRNLSYKWTKKDFGSWDWATGSVGNNIPFSSEYMDGNFDGKDELVATLWQVKWEPGPNLNFDNVERVYSVNRGVKPVKFVDVNNDGIPDIFAMGTCANCIGLGQVNGNPLVAFISNKKDGKFYMYNTGLSIDWGANLEFGDFMNNRKIQILTRVWGGNYRVYEFDTDFSMVASKFQVNAQLNDSRITIEDINNDSYPDVITVDNTGKVIGFINNQQYEFVRKVLGTIPFNSNNLWSMFGLRAMDLNQDGFKDILWMENAADDGNWQSSDYFVRAWIQTKGADELKRTAPAKIAADAVSVSNNGYKVKVKWTPTKDNIDPYIFANLKIDTLLTYASARINNGYNYRKSDATIPIILDKVAARNYPDSLEFNDVNLNSKKPYYIALQMVNKDGLASDYREVSFIPTDPLQSIDNAIPGLYNARFAWGDYNNDGLLDLAVMGQNDDVGNVTKIYENKGGSFVDLNLANKGFRYGDIKWVDLNNDGWLDVAMIGQPGGSGVSFQLLINNKGVFEVVTPTSVFGLKYSSMTFGDYDNNGTLDMFTTGQDATGNPKSYLYKNDGRGNLTIDPEFNAWGGFPNLSNADARFVDYDLDGDLDLIYAGTDQGNNPNGGIRVNTLLDPKVSTNNYGSGSYNNGYTYYMGLNMKNARFDIGDIDGDGDIDVAAIGTARATNNGVNVDYPQLLLLRNQTIENKNAKFGNYFYYGSIYNTQNLILDSIENGDVKLVDFNNDGLLDITVTGVDAKANPVTKFYLNEGGFGNYTLSKNSSIPQLQNSALSWGDADGDGSMDLVISGNKAVGSTTGIYLNKQGDNVNKAPSAPKNLRFIDQGQGRVLLLWDAATDDKTSPANMYYNLKLGTKNGLSDLRVIQVNRTTDQLQTPNTSLIQSNQYYLELPPGAYYWSVQAVDGNYSSSKFAPTQKIVLKYSWQFLNQGGIVDTRIQPLEKPSFAWADVNNKGVFDFLYLGKVPNSFNNGQDYGNPNTPVGLYRNMGGKFIKLKNDSTQFTLAGRGTGFNDQLAGVVNAEIKWVDINNDGLVDLTVAGNDANSGRGKFVVFKNKGDYKFENITNAVYNGSPLASPKIEYIDLDNNGYKDLIYTGLDDQANGVFKFIGIAKDTAAANKNGFKSAVIKNNLESLLSGISEVNLTFGDINKDLKPDMAILYYDQNGRRNGEVYMNTSDTTLSEIKFQKSNTISLPALRNSTLDLIDYNGDGLMDLSLSGTSSSTGQVFRVYQNKWLDSAAKTVQFVQTNSDVKAFESGQTTWGDINADGFPDIIFGGTRTGVGPIASMALADPSTALTNGIVKYKELSTFPFGNYTAMRPSLGDFQGRRVLDVVLVGTEKIIDPQAGTSSLATSFKILKNVRDQSARVTDTAALVSKKIMPKDIIASSRVKFVGEAGSLVSGINADSTIAVADSNYVDGNYAGNDAPTPPKIDTSKIVSQVGTQFLVQLSWKAAQDDHTPSSGLSYSVAMGTKPNSTDVIDPNASLETGTRKTPLDGNAGTNTSITTLLAPGTYYWTVQAIDASKTGSKFAGFKTISVSTDRKVVERFAPFDILLNDSTTANYFMKANDSAGFSYKIKGLSSDTTAVMKYSIVSDASFSSDAIFRVDTTKNLLLLKSQPTAASYKVKLRATDNFGAYYEKAYNFSVAAAPSKILVNDKDNSFLYYRSSAALAGKFPITLKGQYATTPSSDPVLTYTFVNDKDGSGNSVFELANSVLINKRNLNDVDTLKLKVQVADQNGLSTTRIINLINLDCTKKATFSVKSSAVACLPDLVNLKDSSITAGSAAGLKYTYFSDAGVTAVADPTKVGTSGAYYIAAADSAGCTTYKSITVTVSSKPAAPTISASSVCQNATAVKLTYTAPSSNIRLVWYGTNATGGTASTATPSFNTSAAGTISYYVAQADTVAGCYGDRVKLDIKVLPTPAASTITREADGSLVSSVTTSGLKWYWYKDNALVDSTTSKYKPKEAGSYTVKVADNGCVGASSANYYYLVNAVMNLSGGQFIRMSPNPFGGNVNFDYVVNGYRKLNVTVIENATGRVVATKKDIYSGTKMNFGNLAAGMYIIRVTSPDGKFRQQFKVVKQQN